MIWTCTREHARVCVSVCNILGDEVSRLRAVSNYGHRDTGRSQTPKEVGRQVVRGNNGL